MIIKARYVVPVEGPVIENGAVVMDQGCISAVGPARDHRTGPVTDYGDAVICPGFVNAHTHLELSLLADRVPTGPDFVAWLRRLVTILEASPPTREQVDGAVRSGITQSLACGVTLVGDITRSPDWTRPTLAESVLRGVSFGEVAAIGNRRHLLDERLAAAACTRWQTQRLRIGISPHAPYTVEPHAMRACAERAQKDDALLCTHLAETVEEELFTRSGTGPFVEYLRDLGVWDGAIPTEGCGPVELARRTGLLGKRTVVAHANYVTDEDIGLIARGGASVAYCPRTHHAFGHPPHRFRDMLAAGVNVCLGTDSLASNPSLSILDELRFLRREHPDWSPDEILAMGTSRGARALGFAKTTGSISAGKSADLVIVPLDAATSGSGWESMLETARLPIAVYVAGHLLS